MPSEKTRFLIVGGGLAGLLLAWQLRNEDLLVLGGTSIPPASDVSAGVLNPITGSRLTLMDDFDEYRDAARRIYREIPAGDQHYFDTSIRRYFLNELEMEFYEKHNHTAKYERWLGERFEPGVPGPAGDDPLGSFTIHGVGRVEPVPILDSIRKELGDRYRAADANWESFSERDDALRLNDIEARSIVTCEGVANLTNPFFRWLPFRPLHGETLTVHLPEVSDFPEIIHHRKWAISLGDQRFRIGATYRKEYTGTEGLAAAQELPPFEPSTEGRSELMAACRKIFSLQSDPTILEHRSGVRPSTRDRVPYFGPHPTQRNLYIANGLGSKGALYAPRLTERLAHHLTDGSPLPPETLPSRMIRRGFEPAP